MDILYILGYGSTMYDWEIRLSLRTLDKYATNVDRVFIVGKLPAFVKDVIHIPCGDPYQPSNNHFLKVFAAIDGNISENFLLMNDDFYMMRPFDVEKYPYYVRGKMELIENPSRYQKMLNRTLTYLQDKGHKTVWHYGCHCPIIYNKTNFLQLKPIFEKVKYDLIGLSPRILYGNMFVKRHRTINDPKMHEDVLMEVNDAGCLSSSPKCQHVLNSICKMFPKRSRWEK
ncbi:MAG: hypothetical protein J6S67_11030 [Methanobrevibacter sp.]|nr:hypothetical protein [Methanobrevibacter sp.]